MFSTIRKYAKGIETYPFAFFDSLRERSKVIIEDSGSPWLHFVLKHAHGGVDLTLHVLNLRENTN